jgi:hypothetical protein
MYTHINFKSKKALREAVEAGEVVTAYQPGPFGPQDDKTDTVCLEGPHYPEPHRWYAKVDLVGGRVVKVYK